MFPILQKLDFRGNTRFIFIWTKLLSTPLESMCGLLAFILYKELHASPLQITLLISARPIVALLSFYGNLIIEENPHKLKPFIIGSTLISFLPFLLFPFINNIWFFILAYAIFMMSNRAIIPAWSEIFRINLPHQERGKVFSLGSTASYLANIVIPLVISPLIDLNPNVWKIIFFCLAIIHFSNVIAIYFIKIDIKNLVPSFRSLDNLSVKSILTKPWKDCWSLIKERKDFRMFQVVFMLGGGGLMLMQPVFPVFFKETLQLSYLELTLAISFFKGIGFAFSSPLWAHRLHRISIHLFNSHVTFLAALFGLLLLSSTYDSTIIYLAYLIYGVMQAGSELSWNLSGPIFSQDKASTLFSGINVVMVGLRGCFVPFLGELLFLNSNAVTVFFCGGGLCLLGSCFSAIQYLKSTSRVATTIDDRQRNES